MFERLWSETRVNGIPVSQYVEYNYTPCEDITAYELALIIRMLLSASAIVPGPICVAPGHEPDKWDLVKRHFTKV